MVLEPKAMDLLKAMSAKLAKPRRCRSRRPPATNIPEQARAADRLHDALRRDDAAAGQAQDTDTRRRPGFGVLLRRQGDDGLRAGRESRRSRAAPPTVEEALKVAYNTAALYFPFVDLLVDDPYAALTDGAILAFYIGPSTVVAGTTTDMLAWANKDVFLQIWIGADDKLPRRVRAVFAADPQQLRHELELSNWKLDADVTPDTFTSVKAQAAPRIAFRSPTTLPPGMKPLVKMTPAKPAPAKPQSKTP